MDEDSEGPGLLIGSQDPIFMMSQVSAMEPAGIALVATAFCMAEMGVPLERKLEAIPKLAQAMRQAMEGKRNWQDKDNLVTLGGERA